MNSKEALERLLEMAIENGLWKSGLVEDLENTIKQDLDKLEKLEQENNSLRAFVGNLQFCRERETRKIEELEKKNQVLREKVNHFKNVKNRMRRNCKFYEKENTKLRKVIEILKDNYPIKFLGFNKYGAKPYEIMVNGYIQGFEKEQYELLKEVLGNEC